MRKLSLLLAFALVLMIGIVPTFAQDDLPFEGQTVVVITQTGSAIGGPVETLGPEWLTNEWFRFGASSLANDVLMQIAKIESGGDYQSPCYFSQD